MKDQFLIKNDVLYVICDEITYEVIINEDYSVTLKEINNNEKITI